MRHPLETKLREMGTAIDPFGTKALYEYLLRRQDQSGSERSIDLHYGDHARHRLDVYCPQGQGDGPFPVLVFMHGGGFLRGDKVERVNIGRYFARHGVVTVVPNYRLAPEAQWPAGAEDAASALAWTCEHIARYGGDPARVFLGGESAGAVHAGTAALIGRFRRPGVGVAGAILASGVYNVELEWKARRQFGTPTPDPRNEAYFGTDFAAYRERSLLHLVDAAPFPLFLSYAELDPPQMQVQTGQLFAELVTEHGFSPDLRVVPAHNHLSQLFAINVQDDVLGEMILDFIHATVSRSTTRAD
jgi:acetyl esterase/lipase